MDPGQSLPAMLFFRFCHSTAWLLLTVFYRLRAFHRERVPETGGLIVVSNHQSHLDPPIVGVTLRRRHIVPIAKQGLFRNRVLGWLITNLNSISINEKEGDAVAIRKAIKELAKGRCVLIFPEGSRTPDGNLQPFKRGAWVLVSRAKCSVLPVAIEGAFDAWPRSQRFPSLWRQRVMVSYGEPISFDRLEAMGPDASLKLIAETIDELRSKLRATMQR
ncbi:MAG: 1-acyl-sn-glycerol-3-phosphate acyltransferase [Anaerolineae bacterium]|nr:1-acyl-sn-glycerol-3-phosphate acyltransferase [Phycisphaerae bacterium]